MLSSMDVKCPFDRMSALSKKKRHSRSGTGSPWLEQLDAERRSTGLSGDQKTDIAIIGAGIAGITTAYFLLKQTSKRIILIEGGRLAHGATGHNAGQLVSYFERPFSDIVKEFGLEMAADGQRSVESAWEHLEEIRNDLHLKTPCAIFRGYAGCTDLEELRIHFQNNQKRLEAGLPTEMIWIAESFAKTQAIPKKFRKLYQTVPQTTISHLLETKDKRYIAALAGKKGCMNSAQFCEEVIALLLQRFPKRLILSEHTPIKTVKLRADHAELVSNKCTINAKRVILCTNGFERLHIRNELGTDIDTKFHHLVRGSVGYMAAFLESPQMYPTAVSYLPSHHREASGAYDSDPYFYLTRRPYGEDGQKSLICIGGPEALMDDTNGYSVEHPYPEEAKKLINQFVQKTYRHTPRRLTFSHLWHGLMGYTPNGIRCVGVEPCNQVLLYNLGCNGVGILPSIYGSFRISQIINGEPLKPSIFDPVDQRCFLPPHKKPLFEITKPKHTQQLLALSVVLGLLLTVYFWMKI